MTDRRKPFQFGLASLWGLLTLAAVLAWAASIFPQFGTILLVAAAALVMISGALGVAIMLDAGLGPELRVRSLETESGEPQPQQQHGCPFRQPPVKPQRVGDADGQMARK